MLLPAVPPVGAAAQARAELGNSGGRIAVAADYLLGSELTASRRQSGRAGPNAASGRNVGQVCANSAATKLHHWFSWAGRVEEGRLAGTYRQPTVSLPRSSNWTCPFRTSSFPTGFTAALTRAFHTT